MFAAKHRLLHGAPASSGPVTLAAFPHATSLEFSAPDSPYIPRKMNVLCFDNDTKPFCRNPFVFISIQNPRGVYPLHFKSCIVNELQNALSHTGAAGAVRACSPRKANSSAGLD